MYYDLLGCIGMYIPHTSKQSYSEILLQKHSTMQFIIAIYHLGPCKLFHFLESADWYDFCMLRSAFCSEMGTGSIPLTCNQKMQVIVAIAENPKEL